MTDANSGASQEAIEFHYDMPAEFFALWLGKSMTYTAARFSRPDMTLGEARLTKSIITWMPRRSGKVIECSTLDAVGELYSSLVSNFVVPDRHMA